MLSRAFLKVQDGCDQFCAYCIVPYLRGKSRSRKAEKIVEKIKKLEKKGVKEVILCGINLADYKPSLASLLKKTLKKTNVPRIRLGSINLEVFDDKFISLWQDSRLCPHFHISLQSGCNQTLKRMGRKYTFGEFKKLVSKIRRQVKNVNITTDFLVGFPGETEKDFEESLKDLKSLKLGKIHVFRYSPREGTRVAKMEDRIAEKVKSKRAKKVRDWSQKMSEELAKKFIGKKLKVLFEKEKNGWFEGLSENYIRVRARGKDLRGKIKAVRIKTQKGGILYGSQRGKLC
jgi:threonylcarbamoyladenosine tRNA methylthiotransferase MtaB